MSEFEKVLQGRVPAKQTLEFFRQTDAKFDKLETMTQEVNTQIQLMKKDIATICEKLEQHTVDQKEQFHELNTKIDGFITSADGRYAEKKLESIFYKVCWTIVLIVVGAIASAIFRLIFK